MYHILHAYHKAHSVVYTYELYSIPELILPHIHNNEILIVINMNCAWKQRQNHCSFASNSKAMTARGMLLPAIEIMVLNPCCSE